MANEFYGSPVQTIDPVQDTWFNGLAVGAIAGITRAAISVMHERRRKFFQPPLESMQPG
jgi:hypothetical protein